MQPGRNKSANRGFLEPAIKDDDIVAFTEQLCFMVEEGLPLVRSLEALKEQEKNRQMKGIIQQILSDLESGYSFSEACAKHESILSEFFISMLIAGERGVGLPIVLKRTLIHMEKGRELRNKVKGVFTYPLVVGGFCFLIVTFLIVFITPVFGRVYGKMGVILPLPTQILIDISTFVTSFWYLILGFIATIIIFFSHPKSAEFRKSTLHNFLRKTPFIGEVSKKVAIAKFIRTFSSMLVCHVSVLDALDVSERVVNHPDIANIIKSVKREVETGIGVTDAIKNTAIFSPMIVQMINVGEQSGNIGELLEKCALALEIEVDNLAKRALFIIEPTLTIGVAFVVGFIALSIYMPMFDMMGHVK
jgi:type IV pilus assembly protein PilC